MLRKRNKSKSSLSFSNQHAPRTGIEFNVMITPEFIIKPELGKVVPAVDPADLKAVLSLSRTVEGKTAAIGMSLIREACSPGANVGAVVWRWMNMGLAPNLEATDAVIELFATFPFRFVEVDGNTYKLNGEEFTAECEKLVA